MAALHDIQIIRPWPDRVEQKGAGDVACPPEMSAAAGRSPKADAYDGPRRRVVTSTPPPSSSCSALMDWAYQSPSSFQATTAMQASPVRPVSTDVAPVMPKRAMPFGPAPAPW